MDPFKYDLAPDKQQKLAVLFEHTDFKIIHELLEDACQQTVKALVKVDPEKPDYDAILKARQLVASVTNDVCATLWKSIQMHARAAYVAKNVKEQEQQQEAQKPDPQFGKVVVRKRPVEATQ